MTTPASRRLPRWARRARVVPVVCGLLIASAGAAFAYFTVGVTYDPTNFPVALADNLPAGATPTAATTPAANSTTIGLTFATTATTTSLRTVSTYQIRRYATGSSTVSATLTCAPPVGSFTCTEVSVPDGSWQYSDAAALAGSSWVGTESAKSTAVIVDTSPPTSTISFPVAAAFYNNAGWSGGCNVSPFILTNSICGTATDPGTNPSGVSTVKVSVQSTSGTTNSKYWGGGSFNQTSEQKVAAAFGSGNWTYSFPAANFPADGTYMVRAYATDNAGNTQTTATSTAFNIENAAPTVPAPGLTAAVTFGSNPTFVSNEPVNLTDAATEVGGSGVKSVSYYFCGYPGSCTAGTGTLIGSSTTGPTYQVTWATPLPADAPYQIVAVATDNAGNTSASSAPTLVTVDTTPPIVSRPIANGHS